jgi:hypothetical protein
MTKLEQSLTGVIWMLLLETIFPQVVGRRIQILVSSRSLPRKRKLRTRRKDWHPHIFDSQSKLEYQRYSKNLHLKCLRRVKVESQLSDLESKLTKLKASHEEAAKVLRQRALALAALPREMRDAIFEQIYVQDTPIEVTWSRLGNNYVFEMPKDSALYMSSLHVGTDLAHEAAEIFYKRNTFTFDEPSFSHWTQAQLDSWFSRDHYGSGIMPKDFIRNLEIRMYQPGYCYNNAIVYVSGPNSFVSKLCNHLQFEDICDNVSQDWQDYRPLLRSLLRYETLQHIRFIIPQLGDRFDTAARILNPIVRELRATGVKVTFEYKYRVETDLDLNESRIFDEPSDDDFAEYYQVTQRRSVFVDNPERDLFETWKIIDSGKHQSSAASEMPDAFLAESGKFGFMRVWLHEHYEMHKLHKRDRELLRTVEKMVEEFRLLPSEERDMRRRLYSKIMEHFR